MFSKSSKTGNRGRSSQVVRGGQDFQFRRGNPVLSRSQRQKRRNQELSGLRQAMNVKKQRRHQRILKITSILSLVALVAILFRLSVGSVNIASTGTLPAENRAVYQTFVEDYTKQKVLFSQSWLLEKQDLSNSLIKQYPEIEEARISTKAPFSRTIKVDLTFRRPQFSWTDVGKTKRFLDSNGVIFDKNLTPETQKSLISVEDSSGVVLESGQIGVSSSTSKLISALPGLLKTNYKQGRAVKKIEIPTSTREIRVYPEGVGYYIKMSTDRDVGEQVSDLQEVLRFLKKKSPAQYIDVRIANKAFYK